MNKKNKQGQEEHRRLIQEYDIQFEALPRRKWPPEYEPIFSKIHDIELKKFYDYRSDENFNSTSPSQGELELKRRTRELVDQATICRNDCANEATWRLKTEHMVLRHFDDQVAW